MRIDHFLMEELEQFSLVDKAMAILTDVQEIAKKNIEAKSNVLERFEIPFRVAFEEFFEKEGKPLQEANPSYKELAQAPLMQKAVIEFSLGERKTSRKESIFREAFSEYLNLLEKKTSKAVKGEEGKDLEGIVEDPKLLSKVKDLVEFIYIYRFNRKETERVLNFLNSVYNRKYGKNFLQNNMNIYQILEQKVENLVNIPDKEKHLEELIKKKEIRTGEFFVNFYWFYARGMLDSLLTFLANEALPLSFRDYIAELLLKRSEIRSEEEKITESVKNARKKVRDVILKLNSGNIPAISKEVFERMMVIGVKYFPDYFKINVVTRIKNNVYNYIKSEKIKNE